MMLSQVRALWIEDQRIATVAIGFGERPINGDRLARVLEWPFALFDHDRHMPIDNHPSARIDAKLVQHFLAERWRVDESKVRIFLFLMGRLSLDEVGLEGGHFVFAEHGGQRASPEIPECVQIMLVFVAEGAMYPGIERLKQGLSSIRHPIHQYW